MRNKIGLIWFLLGVLITLVLTHNYTQASGPVQARIIESPDFNTCYGIFNGRGELVGGNCINDHASK